MQCTHSMLNGIDCVHSPIKYTYIATRLTGALAKCKSNDKESFGDYFSRPNTLEILWHQTNQKLLLVLQHIPKYTGKSASTNTLRIRISPEPEKYALDSVFQNLRISAYQWKRKTEFEQFLLHIRKYLGQWKRALDNRAPSVSIWGYRFSSRKIIQFCFTVQNSF